VPTNYDGTDLMTQMWVEAVLPEADLHYAEAVKEMYREGVDEIGVVVSEGAAPTLQPGESKPRNVMTFDGAWQQVRSMFEDINEALSDRGFEGYKFAAASTMVQQPNDVGHMHKALKKCFKGKKYRDSTFTVPMYLKGFDKTLRDHGLDAGSFATYWKALCSLERMLSKTCTIPMVCKGFELSGIYPVNQNIILSKWCGWSRCTEADGLAVIGRLPLLGTMVQLRGRVTDDEIEGCMAGLLTFNSSTRKKDTCAINHGRCLWTNNKVVVDAYKAKRERDDEIYTDKQNIEMIKQWRLEDPEAAARDDALVLARAQSSAVPSSAQDPVAAPLTASTTAKRPRKCSNPYCNKTGTKLETKDWTGCSTRNCTLLFCESCSDNSLQHQSICEKPLLKRPRKHS
jgi:hypothetical protein